MIKLKGNTSFNLDGATIDNVSIKVVDAKLYIYITHSSDCECEFCFNNPMNEFVETNIISTLIVNIEEDKEYNVSGFIIDNSVSNVT